MQHIVALGMPGLTEWIIIGAIGLLLFGKRLPEVGRGMGQAITNFKKGLKEGETEIAQVDEQLERKALYQQQQQAAGYKFDPHTGKPVEQGASSTTTSAS